MARGSATEEDLASGLKAVGVLGAVAGTPRRRDNPFAGNLSPGARSEPPVTPERHTSPPEPEVPPPAPKARPAPEAPREAVPRAPIEALAQAPEPEPAPSSAAPRYTDPVTVPMTAEMRTRATLLAAELQRRRTDKANRFTANSVFRVAIELLLSRFELRPEDHVDSDEELRELVLERFDPRHR